MNLRERLREGLRRTREQLGIPAPGEAPDWEKVEESLVLADVGLAATREILTSVSARKGDFRENLRAALLEILARAEPPRSDAPAPRPRVTMMVGVNGVGKTTSVAKLAALYSSQGRKVLMVAADTFRAAAQEQLALWAERASVNVSGAEPGRDPASVVHDGISRAQREGFDDVVVDTAGRLHTKRPLMEEIAKVARIAGKTLPGAPHETLLVLDATVGTNGLHQAKQFLTAAKVTGIVLAKMDGTARGGAVIAIARELALPVRYLGVGEGLRDLLVFDAEEFVSALLAEP